MSNDLTVKLGLDDADLPQPVQRVNQAIATIGKTGEISARQTAAAMRTLPAQFTDIATQLAGGQSPLLVLLQQGGQIKDSFGGIGPALRALGTYITPVTVGVTALGAAVGAYALAAVQGSRESTELRNSLILTGNAAGLTGARFDAAARQVQDSTQQTIGGARAIVMDLAATGQVGTKVLTSMATAVGRVADVTNGDASKIAGDFANMAGGVAKWAAEHNKAWNFISVEQYRYIRRLEEQGKAEEAMIFVNERVIQHLAQQQQNLGYLEKAWHGIKSAASSAWDAMLGAGREQSTVKKIDDLQAQLTAAQQRLQDAKKSDVKQAGLGEQQREVDRLRQDIYLLQEKDRMERRLADSQAARAAKNRKDIEDERKAEGKAPEFPFGAIREAAAQYRADFLRSEKGVYAELDEQRRKEIAANLKDPLGEFLEEKVLPADKDRQDRRLTQEASFLQQYVDANARAAAELLADERARGAALIALDRDIAMRRVQEMGLAGGARDEASRLIDEQARLAREKLEADVRKSDEKLADQAGRDLYNSTRDALSRAFADTSRNPLQAFGNALANVIYTRASASLLDALATAAVGSNGRGGLLGDLLGAVGSITGGGIGVNISGIGTNRTGTSLPTAGGMATGTNYIPRNMLALVHEGEAIVPKAYNPAAGGRGAGLVIQNNQQYHIDARADRAAVLRDMADIARQSNERLIEDLRDRGLIAA